MTKNKEYETPLVTEGMLDFLDDLQESGKTNMFGAGLYLESEFKVVRSESNEILGYWMSTWDKRHNEEVEA